MTLEQHIMKRRFLLLAAHLRNLDKDAIVAKSRVVDSLVRSQRGTFETPAAPLFNAPLPRSSGCS